MANRRDSEAARVLADIYRLGQERAGLRASLYTLQQWRNVNTNKPEAGPWLIRIIRAILGLRRSSRLLARRYYNLSRAISGGEALSNPSGPAYPSVVPLTRLLDDFGDALDEITRGPVGARRESRSARRARLDPEVTTPTPAREESVRERVEEVTDELEKALDAFERRFKSVLDVKVEVTDFDWSTDESVEATFTEDFQRILQEQITRLEREIKNLERDVNLQLEERKTLIEKKTSNISYESAGVSGQGTVDAGREEVLDVSDVDDMVHGWMRITGPNPCAFCAMLASRGVLYKSRETALLTPGLGGKSANRRARRGSAPLEKYHPNCMCEVVPVFNDAPIKSERDKFFEKNWGHVTKGYGGNDALNAWRRWLTEQYKIGAVPIHEITST